MHRALGAVHSHAHQRPLAVLSTFLFSQVRRVYAPRLVLQSVPLGRAAVGALRALRPGALPPGATLCVEHSLLAASFWPAMRAALGLAPLPTPNAASSPPPPGGAASPAPATGTGVSSASLGLPSATRAGGGDAAGEAPCRGRDDDLTEAERRGGGLTAVSTLAFELCEGLSPAGLCDVLCAGWGDAALNPGRRALRVVVTRDAGDGVVEAVDALKQRDAGLLRWGLLSNGQRVEMLLGPPGAAFA